MRGHWPFLLLAGLYLAIALPWLDRPGLEYDEAYFVNPALVTLSGDPGEPRDFCHQTIAVAGHTLPLRLFAYGGALKAWLWAPIFGVCGVSLPTIRVPAILLGLVAIWLVWRASCRWLGRGWGTGAALLFALDPGFLCNVRCDTGPLALAMVCGALALVCLQRALAARSAAWWLALSGAIALGFFDKLTFVWTCSGLLLGALVAFREELFALAFAAWIDRRLRWCAVGTALIGLCYAVFGWMLLRGSRELVGFDWRAKLWTLWQGLGGETLLHEFQTGAVHQRPGFLQTLWYDADQLRLSVQGQVESGWPAWFTRWDLLHGTLLPLLLGLALAALPFVLRRVDAERRKLGVFLGLACLTDYGLLYVAQGTGLPHHFPLGFPYPQLLLVFVAREMPRWLGAPALGLQLVLCLFVNARTVATYATDGGNGSWSDAITTLCAKLQARPEEPVFLDWGMRTQWIAFAGRGRPSREIAVDTITNRPHEVPRMIEQARAQLRALVAAPQRFVLVTLDPRFEWYPSTRMLIEEGGRLEPIESIPQRDGRPLFQLWRLR